MCRPPNLQVWEILHEHFSEILETATPDIKNQSIRMIIDYIDQHYAEPLELEEIAKKAGWAKSTCCREFKKTMNCTIFEYIMNCRLSQSERLLLSSDHTITEIAGLCGFDTSSYFIRNFKARTGISPTAYRRKYAGKL